MNNESLRNYYYQHNDSKHVINKSLLSRHLGHLLPSNRPTNPIPPTNRSVGQLTTPPHRGAGLSLCPIPIFTPGLSLCHPPILMVVQGVHGLGDSAVYTHLISRSGQAASREPTSEHRQWFAERLTSPVQEARAPRPATRVP